MPQWGWIWLGGTNGVGWRLIPKHNWSYSTVRYFPSLLNSISTSRKEGRRESHTSISFTKRQICSCNHSKNLMSFFTIQIRPFSFYLSRLRRKTMNEVWLIDRSSWLTKENWSNFAFVFLFIFWFIEKAWCIHNSNRSLSSLWWNGRVQWDSPSSLTSVFMEQWIESSRSMSNKKAFVFPSFLLINSFESNIELCVCVALARLLARGHQTLINNCSEKSQYRCCPSSSPPCFQSFDCSGKC